MEKNVLKNLFTKKGNEVKVMRKKILAMIVAGAFVLSAASAAVAVTDPEWISPDGDPAWSPWGTMGGYTTGNQWNTILAGEKGADYWEWMPSTGNKYSSFTGPKDFGGMDIAAGYAENGRFAKYSSDKNVANNTPDTDGTYIDYDVYDNSTYDKRQSRIEFDTNEPLSAPTYSLPCPFEPLRDRTQQNIIDGAGANDRGGNSFENTGFNSSHFDCSYVARDPQTNDIGSADGGAAADGIVFDDLYQYMEDYTEENTTDPNKHIAQALDILFYNNSTDDDGVALTYGVDFVAEDGMYYKQGLGIDQTLDQDLAHMIGTTKNGMSQVLWQNFNLARLGADLHTESATGDVSSDGVAAVTSEVGWLDQVVSSYIGDIDPDVLLPGGGNQGIVTSYLSKVIIPGVGGDVCGTIFAGCTVNEIQGHANVDLNGDLNSDNTIDKTVHHGTDSTMVDP